MQKEYTPISSDLEEKLLEIAQKTLEKNDIAHNFEHARQVLKNAKILAQREGGDMHILAPGALFHDAVVYTKDDKKAKQSSEDSAAESEEILKDISDFPQDLIEVVKHSINHCSTKEKIPKDKWESIILHDADNLEKTGLHAVMRTMVYQGLLGGKLYHEEDPFHETSRDRERFKYAFDYILKLLEDTEHRFYTGTARTVARDNNERVRKFLDLFREEREKRNEMLKK